MFPAEVVIFRLEAEAETILPERKICARPKPTAVKPVAIVTALAFASASVIV